MVFTVAQTAAFFVGQMGIPEATRLELQHEGCEFIDDLANFTDDTWKQVAENFKKPRGMVPDPAVAGAMIPAPPIVFSQRAIRPTDPTLARNYGTNDRMLRYKRINEYFFMDTYMATKKGW